MFVFVFLYLCPVICIMVVGRWSSELVFDLYLSPLISVNVIMMAIDDVKQTPGYSCESLATFHQASQNWHRS